MHNFVFGFVLALSVGPVAILIVNYAIRSGPGSAAHAALGAATADGIYALVAFTLGKVVTATLVDHVTLFRLSGSILLLAMGVRMLWSATKSGASSATVEHKMTARPFVSVLLITLANPLTVLLFYAYATSVSAAKFDWITGPVSVFAGSLAGQIVFAAGGSAIGRFVKSDRALYATNIIAGLVVVAYGVAGFLRADSVWHA